MLGVKNIDLEYIVYYGSRHLRGRSNPSLSTWPKQPLPATTGWYYDGMGTSM